jgi:ureidoglycolate lyase
MRFLHVTQSGTSAPALAVEATGGALVLADVLDDAPRDLQELIERGQGEWKRVWEMTANALSSGVSVTPPSEFTRESAVLRPPAIIAIGLNYAEHAEELGLDIHADPTVFPLLPNSLAADGATLRWSHALTAQLDYECELGVVIGKPAKDVSVDKALDYVFGYTVVNDLTARDIQFREQQWTRCKSFDGFSPVGPVVISADELTDPQNLHILTTVNGDVVQDSTTGNMIRGVAELISYLSRGTTLLPGTLISTGTPAGAGISRNPQVLLKDGDTVVATIESIGSVTTHCNETD